jgi:lysophospholipase L1-like esterase
MVSLPLPLRPVILLFGDSITQQGFGWEGTSVGWVSLLSRDYSRRADVLNRGFSGYNTNHALQVLPTIVSGAQAAAAAAQEVLFATVFFGANDAALPGELQHVPLEEYGQNLAAIVDLMRTANLQRQPSMMNTATTTTADEIVESTEQQSCPSSSSSQNQELPIILFTPPPVDIVAWNKERGLPKKNNKKPNNDRANSNAKKYGDVVKGVGNETNCPVLDVFDLLGGNGPVEEYGTHLRDGLHLSESGNVLVYKGLMKLLQNEYPHLLPMNDGQGKYGKVGIPLDGTLWREWCAAK